MDQNRVKTSIISLFAPSGGRLAVRKGRMTGRMVLAVALGLGFGVGCSDDDDPAEIINPFVCDAGDACDVVDSGPTDGGPIGGDMPDGGPNDLSDGGPEDGSGDAPGCDADAGADAGCEEPPFVVTNPILEPSEGPCMMDFTGQLIPRDAVDICDGLDNDCDGEIDEEGSLEAACVPTGVAVGATVFAEEVTQLCVDGQQQPPAACAWACPAGLVPVAGICAPAVTPSVVIFEGPRQQAPLMGREGADALCLGVASAAVQAAQAAGTVSVRALLSVTAQDEIADMPARYGVPADRPVVGPNGVAIAANWADLVDGSLAVSLKAAGVEADTWYTGSTPWAP